MKSTASPNDDSSYALSDFLDILKRHRKAILGMMGFCAVSLAIYTLLQPTQYEAVATFREKGRSSVGIHQSFTDMFLSGTSISVTESEAISNMHSRSVLTDVIRELGLQVTVISPSWFEFPDLATLRDNLRTEWALFNRSRFPSLPDAKEPLTTRNVTYTLPIPTIYTVKVEKEGRFSFYNENGKSLGEGEIGIPFQQGPLTLTLFWETPHAGRYDLYLTPEETMVKGLGLTVKIEADTSDKSLLKLTYKSYLKDEKDHIATQQLAYLEERQYQNKTILQSLLENHAATISEDLAATGFVNSDREMEFIAHKQSEIQQKLHDIDLEKKRLTQVAAGECAYYDRFTDRGDPSIINQLLTESRHLKHQRDGLDIALHEAKARNLATHSIDSSWKELIALRETREEAHQLVASQEKEESLPSLKYLNKSPYQVQAWLRKLQTAETEDIGLQQTFVTYLQNLIRLLQMREATLQECLAHQQNPQKDYQGITLETAQQLYLTYCREQNDWQAEREQHLYLVDRLSDPDFEVSSLSAVLKDPVSTARIQNASALAISLQDAGNRSQKELERTREDLNVQKEFLKLHLSQIAALIKLRQDLLLEKTIALQSAMFELIHQKLSLLDKHLNDYITTRQNNLDQEKELLHDHQHELSTQVAALPVRWASEKMIEQHLQTSEKMMESLSSLVESKNISNNLELIQSAPLDTAISPLHAKSPRLFFYAILGMFIGGFTSATFFTTRSLIRGLPASPANLTLNHLPCAGILNTPLPSPLADRDLDTLRRMMGHLQGTSKILFLLGHSEDYTQALARLYKTGGRSVVILDTIFEKEGEGLLQYLEGNSPNPTLHTHAACDVIESGGIRRDGAELLQSIRFKNLLHELEKRYDFVFVISRAPSTSAAASNLHALLGGAVVTLKGESLIQAQQSLANTFVFLSR